MNGIINGVNHILNTGLLMSRYSGSKAMAEQAAKTGNVNLEVSFNTGTPGAAGGVLPVIGVDPTAGLAPGIGVKVNTVA